MKRRQFVEQLGIGSAVLAAAAGVAEAAQGEHEGHATLVGPLASATVSFGAWPVGTVEAPRDRTLLPLAPAGPNTHSLLPQVAIIKEGGSVNFILAGFHQVVIYAPGKKPADVDQSVLIPIGGPASLIDDPAGRVYRGLDPRLLSPAPPAAPNLLSQDRSEVVSFSKRGLYLVICAVNLHFNEGMFGWVRVIR
jgi:hypothetical protein